jgi:hypothetical protein
MLEHVLIAKPVSTLAGHALNEFLSNKKGRRKLRPFSFSKEEKGKPGQGRPGLPSKPAIAGEGKNRLASVLRNRKDSANCESPKITFS